MLCRKPLTSAAPTCKTLAQKKVHLSSTIIKGAKEICERLLLKMDTTNWSNKSKRYSNNVLYDVGIPFMPSFPQTQ
jgi:hypothetical protein